MKDFHVDKHDIDNVDLLTKTKQMIDRRVNQEENFPQT